MADDNKDDEGREDDDPGSNSYENYEEGQGFCGKRDNFNTKYKKTLLGT